LNSSRFWALLIKNEIAGIHFENVIIVFGRELVTRRHAPWIEVNAGDDNFSQPAEKIPFKKFKRIPLFDRQKSL
jgi:hypothetical protein